MLVNTKKNYYTAKIANCKNDQKQLFNITRNLMGNTYITTMPSFVCPVDMAQCFGYHFIEKVSNIRKDIVDCGEESVDSILMCGVPQGSVLGPTLYCMYTKPIRDTVARHGMHYHCYADNTQIYLTVERDESIVAALKKVELCIAEVVKKNMLKLHREV